MLDNNEDRESACTADHAQQKRPRCVYVRRVAHFGFDAPNHGAELKKRKRRG